MKLPDVDPDADGYCVEHEWKGNKNTFITKDLHKAQEYAARVHSHVEPLYKGHKFIKILGPNEPTNTAAPAVAGHVPVGSDE
jgi:hypothetical protein